jgi:hypothetical protein
VRRARLPAQPAAAPDARRIIVLHIIEGNGPQRAVTTPEERRERRERVGLRLINRPTV